MPPKLREHQAAARAQPTAGKSLISVLGVPATRQSAPHTRSSNTARQGERRQSCRSSWKEFCRRRAGGGELRYLRDVTELWPEALCTSPTGEVPSRAAAAAPPPRTHRRHRRTAANWLPRTAQGPGRLISRVFILPLLIWRVRDIPGGSWASREVTPHQLAASFDPCRGASRELRLGATSLNSGK